MKTLAQLKRDAKTGKISGEMIIRCGGIDIPNSLKGIRKIVDANSVGIKFMNNDGKKSELPIKCASLVEYTKDNLTIYYPGLRDLNTEEQKVMNEWLQIENTKEHQEQIKIDLLTDGSRTYWQKKHFFVDRGYAYLLGFEEQRGLKYDFNTQKIKDNKIKGGIEMQYRIYQN